MKKLVIFIILICMVLSLGFSYSQEVGTQIQDRDRVQSNTSDEEKTQARQEISNRLHINGEAYLQMMQRTREMIENRFTDLEDHWSRDEVNFGYNWGLINGYPDGTFKPNNNISGTEGVLLLARLAKQLTNWEIKDYKADNLDFTLIPNWAKIQMTEKIPLNIAIQNQTYGREPLTRLQFALMLARTLGIDEDEISDEIVSFFDDSLIPDEVLSYIYRLRVLGILEGNNGFFMPQYRLTRGEAVAMMVRAMKMFGIAPDEYTFLDNELTVNLYENPSTGYTWHWKFSDGTILKLIDDDFIENSSSTNMVGQVGIRRFVFQTVKEGVEDITFSYYRSWEDISTAIDTRVISVKVGSDLKIIEVK